MQIRPYRKEDAPEIATVSATYANSESDFALNPLWETQAEFEMEFERFGITPESHLLVADAGDGEVLGFVGFLRRPDADTAGLICPVVVRGGRRRGVGGELLRAAQRLATETLGIRFATAGIGTRNRGGYSLLASHGFRPVRQHFFMRCDARPTSAAAPAPGLDFSAAEPSEAEAIHAIYRTCGFEERSIGEMESALSDDRRTHAVARMEGRVVAFVEIETHWPRRVWVAYVGVADEYRDRGVGSALVAWALTQRFDAGTESAMLLLSPANRSAVRAYEKVGFRRSRLIDVLEKPL